MTTPQWKSREEFSEWWTANVIEFNRLSVADPREFERIVQVIEKFNAENPR